MKILVFLGIVLGLVSGFALNTNAADFKGIDYLPAT